MTAEYIPVSIIGIGDLLVVAIVVLGNHLSKAELTGVPRRLVNFIIAVSFILGLLMFLNICLTAYELKKHRNDSLHAVEESLFGVSEGALSGLRGFAVGNDRVVESSHTSRVGDLRFMDLAERGVVLSVPFLTKWFNCERGAACRAARQTALL